MPTFGQSRRPQLERAVFCATDFSAHFICRAIPWCRVFCTATQKHGTVHCDVFFGLRSDL